MTIVVFDPFRNVHVNIIGESNRGQTFYRFILKPHGKKHKKIWNMLARYTAIRRLAKFVISFVRRRELQTLTLCFFEVGASGLTKLNIMFKHGNTIASITAGDLHSFVAMTNILKTHLKKRRIVIIIVTTLSHLCSHTPRQQPLPGFLLPAWIVFLQHRRQ